MGYGICIKLSKPNDKLNDIIISYQQKNILFETLGYII